MIQQGYRKAASVTKADADVSFGFTQKALYIGGTGDVRVTTAGGDDITFTTVPVGMLYVCVKRIWSTGTSATNIVALGD